MNDSEVLDEILDRVTRIECKLSALMEAMGYDMHGNKINETNATTSTKVTNWSAQQ